MTLLTTKYPAAVVFDLDYTLWPCWCDTHISPPLKPLGKSSVRDRSGSTLSFYPHVELIILELASNNIPIIGASRTATPKVAKQLLLYLHIGDQPAISYFSTLEWGQGSKTKHIRAAAKYLNLEKDLKAGSFILFDDEHRNIDVESINCHFAHIPDESVGLTREIFESELESWRKSFYR